MGRQAQAAMAARTPRLGLTDRGTWVRSVMGPPRLPRPGFCLLVQHRQSGRVTRWCCRGHVWVYRGALARVGACRSSRSRGGTRRRTASRTAGLHGDGGRGAGSSCSHALATPAGPCASMAANALTGSFTTSQLLRVKTNWSRTARGREFCARPEWDPEGLASFLEAARATARKESYGARHILLDASGHGAIAWRRLDTATRATARCGEHGVCGDEEAAFCCPLPPPPKNRTVGCSAGLQACPDDDRDSRVGRPQSQAAPRAPLENRMSAGRCA